MLGMWPAVLAGALLFCGAELAQATQNGIPIPITAEPRFERAVSLATLHLPTGPATREDLPTEPVEGRVLTRSWQVPPDSTGEIAPVLGLITPIRDFLRDGGYDILLDCDTAACGGFDFRRQVDVVPAPDMFLNLRDFRALAARRDDLAVLVLASRSDVAGFLQITRVVQRDLGETDQQSLKPAKTANGAEPASSSPPSSVPSRSDWLANEEDGFAQTLLAQGVAVLDGVEFASGSARLSDESELALDPLVDFLTENPDLRVSLVGHTDADGSLEANIVLSRKRANAVMTYLLEIAGIAVGRLTADGVGYLAPIAPLTDAERAGENRRVEVVLMPK